MIDFPNDVCDNTFDNEIKKGCVLRTTIRFADGCERNKYCVTVSYSSKDDPLVFVLTTTKTDFYDAHPEFNRDIIRLPANKLPLFPKDTIINCRELHTLDKSRLKKSYQNSGLTFIGHLPEDCISKIDDIVKSSCLLSLNQKRCVLGRDFLQDDK